MGTREPLLDPTGAGDQTANTTLATRPQTPKGLVVGLLDDNKPNGAVILRAVGRELREKYGVREYYYERGWTDGLPVIPVTESYLANFMATTGRDPDEVLMPMPHLNKNLTVRLAAINAALAGCLPEYFPVVLAAWDAFLRDGMVTRSIWQSTTGTAPFVVVYGPVRQRIGLNSRGNVWGSGFRANATIGRAIRLGAINGLGLKPHVFDQATQGTPAIAEQGWRTYRDLARTGKEAIALGTGWRLPAGHPDARPQEPPEDQDTPVQLIASPDAVQIVVAGAPNAGVSSIVETFGSFGRAPATVKVEQK